MAIPCASSYHETYALTFAYKAPFGSLRGAFHEERLDVRKREAKFKVVVPMSLGPHE